MESADTAEICGSDQSSRRNTLSFIGRQDSYARVPQEQQDEQLVPADFNCEAQAATKIVVVDGHADNESKWKRNLASAINDSTVTHLSIAHVDLSIIDWQELLEPATSMLQECEQRFWERIEVVDCVPTEQIPEMLRRLLFLQEESIEGITGRVENVSSGNDGGFNLKATQKKVVAIPSVCSRMYISFDGQVAMECGKVLARCLRTTARVKDKTFKGMRQLTVASAQWTSPALRALSVGIEHTSTLEELNLSYSTFLEQEHQRSQSHQTLGSDDHDEQVQVDYDDDTGCRSTMFGALAYGIKRNTSIRCIRFNRCQLHDSAIATLATALVGHPFLKELYLGGNSCNIEGMKAISSLLRRTNGQLLKLGMSNTLPDPNNTSTSDAHDIIERQLQRQSCLKLLFDALSVNMKLECLHLSSNYLQDSDVWSLGRSLASNPRSGLLMLDLKNNDISDSGIKQFCGIGDDSNMYCGDLLGIPRRLQKLWLLGNARLGPIGAQHLLDVMESSHVELLDIRIPTYTGFRPHPVMRTLQASLRYIARLNKGGRRLVLQRPTKQKKYESDEDKHSDDWDPRKSWVLPMGIWPLVFQRVNRMKFGREFGRPNNDTLAGDRADVIYYLLSQSPSLWQR